MPKLFTVAEMVREAVARHGPLNLFQLYGHVGPRVPPEVAKRRYERRRVNSGEGSLTEQVETGQRMVVSRTVRDMVRQGFLLLNEEGVYDLGRVPDQRGANPAKETPERTSNRRAQLARNRWGSARWTEAEDESIMASEPWIVFQAKFPGKRTHSAWTGRAFRLRQKLGVRHLSLWTDAEDESILAGESWATFHAKHPQRTKGAWEIRACRLRASRPSDREFWTDAEIESIRAGEPWVVFEEKFPGKRTLGAWRSKARKVAGKVPRSPTAPVPWTPEEVESVQLGETWTRFRERFGDRRTWAAWAALHHKRFGKRPNDEDRGKRFWTEPELESMRAGEPWEVFCRKFPWRTRKSWQAHRRRIGQPLLPQGYQPTGEEMASIRAGLTYEEMRHRHPGTGMTYMAWQRLWREVHDSKPPLRQATAKRGERWTPEEVGSLLAGEPWEVFDRRFPNRRTFIGWEHQQERLLRARMGGLL